MKWCGPAVQHHFDAPVGGAHTSRVCFKKLVDLKQYRLCNDGAEGLCAAMCIRDGGAVSTGCQVVQRGFVGPVAPVDLVRRHPARNVDGYHCTIVCGNKIKLDAKIIGITFAPFTLKGMLWLLACTILLPTICLPYCKGTLRVPCVR